MRFGGGGGACVGTCGRDAVAPLVITAGWGDEDRVGLWIVYAEGRGELERWSVAFPLADECRVELADALGEPCCVEYADAL